MLSSSSQFFKILTCQYNFLASPPPSPDDNWPIFFYSLDSQLPGFIFSDMYIWFSTFLLSMLCSAYRCHEREHGQIPTADGLAHLGEVLKEFLVVCFAFIMEVTVSFSFLILTSN